MVTIIVCLERVTVGYCTTNSCKLLYFGYNSYNTPHIATKNGALGESATPDTMGTTIISLERVTVGYGILKFCKILYFDYNAYNTSLLATKLGVLG